jgi:hypothetical protein
MKRLAQFRSTLNEHFVEASTSHPTDNWFMLVDAAQYPHNDSIDWGREAQYGRWGNLLLANPEGQEPDLTAWLVPVSGASHGLDLPGWVDLEARPFATTWIQSPYTLYQLTYHWQRLVDVYLPKKKLGMLRFHDGCALQHLMGVLDADQWDSLSAPVRHWIYCDREGTVQAKSREPAPALASFPLELDEEQLALLKRATHVDRIILDLKVAEWIAPDIDVFEAQALVSPRVRIAEQCDIFDLQRQFEVVATTLEWDAECLASSELTSRLQAASSSGDSIVDVLSGLAPLAKPENNPATKGS